MSETSDLGGFDDLEDEAGEEEEEEKVPAWVGESISGQAHYKEYTTSDNIVILH